MHQIPDIPQQVARVAFVKILRLFPSCLERGHVDMRRVRDCVRGIWPVSAARRNRIQYLFAMNGIRVVGVFHVVRVSEEVGREFTETGLAGFPEFPPASRSLDRYVAQYRTVAAARKNLDQSEANRFVSWLESLEQPSMRTPDDVLTKWRKRVYFEVDDQDPADLKRYKGEFFEMRSRWPLEYNF